MSARTAFRAYLAGFERVSPDAAASMRGYTDWRDGTAGVADCGFIAGLSRSRV